MRYLGGKFRIAKEVAGIIAQSLVSPTQTYYEPFVGGLSVACALEEITKNRGRGMVLSDINWALIDLYRAVQDGWKPPRQVSPVFYEQARDIFRSRDPILLSGFAEKYGAGMMGFIGFGCSYGGKFFHGYASETRRERNSIPWQSSRSIQRSIMRLKSARFVCADFRELAPNGGDVMYCDPPYAGTTKYNGVPDFPHDCFWEKARQWAKGGAIVFVSEYSAPEDFVCIWAKRLSTSVQKDFANRRHSIERLFMYRG